MGIKKFDGISEGYCAGNYESYDEETAGSDSVRRSSLPVAGGSHPHQQYLQSFKGIILFYTVNLYRNKVFAMPTHLLYFKPYSLTQNLWPGTS